MNAPTPIPASRVAPPRPAAEIAAAYQHCWQIATGHYENFTLGSWLLPRRLRRHIAAIYAFARTADDIADEGDLPAAERLLRLDWWEAQLDECCRGRSQEPVFIALQDTITAFGLPDRPFRDLLQAFRADVEFTPFATFADALDYCRCSANPVGRLVLQLFGYGDAERQRLADDVCSGLQLANFWQDAAIDARRGRIYVPAEDLEGYGCAAGDLLGGVVTTQLRRLMEFEVARARSLLCRGLALADVVDRRLGREVRLFAWGGLAILAAIESADYDVFSRRPTLSRWGKANLVLRALLAGRRRIGAAAARAATANAEGEP